MLSEFYDIGNTAPVLCFKRAPGNGSWEKDVIKVNIAIQKVLAPVAG
jgi:hypothetical protein